MVSDENDDDHPHPEKANEPVSASSSSGARLRTNVDADRPVKDEAGSGKQRRKRIASPPDDVSRALRSVYDDTVREDIPDDFMDLLGKLS